jgi:ParB family chromosome partitioning protein
MSKPKKSGLGKGLDQLIPLDTTKNINEPEIDGGVADVKVPEAHGKPLYVKIGEIQHNPDQPREDLNKEELNKLANSIKETGILEPLVVFKMPNGYQLVAGYRRLQAATLVNLDKVPVVVIDKTGSDSESLEKALIENIYRSDLNPIEEALSYEKLEKKFSKEVLQIAKLVGKDSSTIRNTKRLLNLPEAVKKDIREARMTAGHGKALLSLEHNNDLLMQARNEVLAKAMTVRETENLVKKLGKQIKKPTNRAKDEVNAYYDSLTKSMSEAFGGLKVDIIYKGKNKKIILNYNTKEDFERILKKLKINIQS